MGASGIIRHKPNFNPGGLLGINPASSGKNLLTGQTLRANSQEFPSAGTAGSGSVSQLESSKLTWNTS